jgi:Na+/H+ antiporter NhaD/arsenite permease-like protein
MIGFARMSLSLFGVIAVVSAVLATATIWLVLTDPVTVANSVNEGDVSPLVRELASAMYEALKGLLKYL